MRQGGSVHLEERKLTEMSSNPIEAHTGKQGYYYVLSMRYTLPNHGPFYFEGTVRDCRIAADEVLAYFRVLYLARDLRTGPVASGLVV